MVTYISTGCWIVNYFVSFDPTTCDITTLTEGTNYIKLCNHPTIREIFGFDISISHVDSGIDYKLAFGKNSQQTITVSDIGITSAGNSSTRLDLIKYFHRYTAQSNADPLFFVHAESGTGLAGPSCETFRSTRNGTQYTYWKCALTDIRVDYSVDDQYYKVTLVLEGCW